MLLPGAWSEGDTPAPPPPQNKEIGHVYPMQTQRDQPHISIVLCGIPALEIILRSVYTGELEIEESILAEIVDLASYLQYEQVRHHFS